MNTAIAKRPLRQVQTVKELLWNDQAKAQLQAVAAKHMTPDRMMRLMANSVRTTPKLAECEPMSLLGALMTCASLGLEPNTVMGHAYLIPFKNNSKRITEVQIVIGYKGLIDLARRSGHITSISANIHYSDDEMWEYEEGTDAKLRHRPGNLEGDKLHAYAIAKFTDGGHAYVVLPWTHVMKIRNQSQGWQTAVRFNKTEKSPWHTHEDEMAKKTAIRALAKYLPLSTEFRDAFEADGAKADYGAFAMDPATGLEIEGETVEIEPEAETSDEPAEAEKQEEEKPKAKASKTKEKSEAEPEEADNSGLVGLIKSELQQAGDIGTVEAVLELYADQIEPLKGGEDYDDIQSFADARREELA